MRIVIVSQNPAMMSAMTALLRACGHELVATISCAIPSQAGQPDAPRGDTGLSRTVPHDTVARPADFATAFGRYGPDLVLCVGVPWKIPTQALGVPRYGVVNGHASLLPRYRGPIPVAWAVRHGEPDVGFTFHRMADTFDTGPILAQARIPLGDEHEWLELQPKLSAAVGPLLRRTLVRVEQGEAGEPQDDGEGSYFGWFEPDYVWIDWSKPALDVYRQVRAWRFAGPAAPLGALAQVAGETARILRVSLTAIPGTTPVSCGDGRVWIASMQPAR